MKQHSWNALRTTGALLIGMLAAGCSGSAGRGSDTTAPPMPTVTITANPTTVMSGATSTLTWTSTNATDCAASGSWSGTRGISGTEVTAPIAAGSAYTLTCSGAGGMAAATANVAVAPAPLVTISATPSTIGIGGATTLMWSTTNATSCTASGSWDGARPIMGSETITGITAASAFTLTCTGQGGTGAATANVTVTQAPTVTLEANPTTVMSGGSTTLTWSSSNTTPSSCMASGGWSGPRGVSGTETITGLTMATSFTLTCSDVGGTGAATANVVIAQAAAPPVVTLTPNPGMLASGAATTLTWSTTDATACTASGAWSGSRATSGTQLQAPITTARAYTLTCTGPGGTGAATANVLIAPRPTVTITAMPSMVASGGSTTLTWTSTNATSCTASGGWTGARATSGNQVQAPITTATVYTLTCIGLGGMGAASANVSIAPPPTVMITATPTSVVSGGASTLTWTSNNANSCVASGSWSGPRGTSGSEMITNITAASAFTLTCTGLGGMGAATANVAIIAPSTQPTVSITANPLTVNSGGSTMLMWSTMNATSCVASDGWSGPRGTSGREMINNITAATRFTLTCTGAGGTGSGTVTVSLAGSFTTNFNLTENPISENGVWRRAGNTFTNVRTANGTAFGTNGLANAFDDSYALLRGFGANYTAQATVQRAPGLNVNVTHEVELLLRFTDDATTARGYECLFSFDGNVQIIRWDGGLNQGMMNFQDITRLQANFAKSPFRTGDVVRASINGSNISVFINGTLVATASDTRYATGDPGIGFFTRPNGNSANFAMDDYSVTTN